MYGCVCCTCVRTAHHFILVVCTVSNEDKKNDISCALCMQQNTALVIADIMQQRNVRYIQSCKEYTLTKKLHINLEKSLYIIISESVQ